MNQDQLDRYYMQMALDEAVKGRGWTNPNPMVGAVIVKDGQVIAKGYHHRCGQGHAEVEAFRAAGDRDVSGATMYVTLEPCSHYGKTPPCADKIVEKKIGRVVVAALDPNPLVAGRGISRIREAGIEVVTGVMAEESIALNEIFMHYIVDKQPYVLYKSAMSLDGKICTAGGESQWISCEESRVEVQALRHQYMAIMVGAGTVLADDPRLTCRIPGGKNPIRVIVDSSLRVPLTAGVVATAREIPTIFACTPKADPERIAAFEAAGVQVLILPEDEDGHTDLKKLKDALGQQQIDSILLEGGGCLADAAFRAGIINKVMFYIAPAVIGGKGALTPVEGAGIASLKEKVALTDLQVRKVGCDLCVTALVEPQERN